jgi:hypothetical protein
VSKRISEFIIGRAEDHLIGLGPLTDQSDRVRSRISEWLGKVEGVTPEDVLKTTAVERRSAVDSAVEWLPAYMKPAKRYDAEELKARAKADLIS